jgi:hypothetical protein
MDTKDWVGMRQLFTDDVVIDTAEAGGDVVTRIVGQSIDQCWRWR